MIYDGRHSASFEANRLIGAVGTKNTDAICHITGLGQEDAETFLAGCSDDELKALHDTAEGYDGSSSCEAQNPYFQLTNHSILWLDSCNITVCKQQYVLRSNLTPVSVWDGGKEIAEIPQGDGSIEIGLLPGHHSLTAKYDDKGTERTVQEEIDSAAGDGSEETSNISFQFDVETINIPDGYQKDEVYLNHKDTGKTVSQYPCNNGSYQISSFSHEPVQIEHCFPWGKEMSHELSSKTDSLSFSMSGENCQNMEDTVIGYLKGYMDAYRQLDAGRIVNDTDQDRQRLADEINQQKQAGKWFDDKLVSVDIDEGQSFVPGGGEDEVVVYTLEHYQGGGWLDSNETANPSNQDDAPNVYYLHYDQNSKKWLIDNCETSKNIEISNNLKTIQMDY